MKKFAGVLSSVLLACGLFSASSAQAEVTITWHSYNSSITGVNGSKIPAGSPVYFFATSKTGVADVRKDLYAAFVGDGLNFDDMPDGYEFMGETTMSQDGYFADISFPASKNGWTYYGYILVSEGTKSSETGTFIFIPGLSTTSSTKTFNTAASFNWTGSFNGVPNSSGAGSFVTGPTLKAKATAFLGAYDGTAKKIDVTVTKKPGDEEASVAYSCNENGPFVAEGSFDWPTDVSTVTVFAQVSYPSWDPVKVSAQLTITQRVATVTAGSAQKEFDATPLTCGMFDAVGFIDGEGIESLSMTAASTITEPGSVDNVIDENSVVLKSGTKVGNYVITYVKGALTVSKRTTGLEVTAIPYKAVYDGAYHVFDLDYTFTGPKTDAEPTILYSTAENGTYYETNNISSLGANYKNCQTSAQTLWAKVSYPGYEDIKVSSTVTIRKRPVTVTAGSAERAYNGNPLTCTTYTVAPATEDTGFVGSEGIASVTWDSNSKITNPGEQVNRITKVNTWSGGATAGNYDVKFFDGLLKVTPIEGLEAAATGWTGFYDASVHKITVNSSGTASYSYDENGTFVADNSFAWPKNVTNVTVYAKVEKTGYVPKIVSADIVIKPRTVVLVAGSGSKAYNGSPLTVTTFSVKDRSLTDYPSDGYGFKGSQNVTLSMTAESTITDPGTQPNVIDKTTIKGNNYFTSAGSTLDNYIILTEPGTLTVTENPNGLRASGTNYEGFYDGQEHGVGVSVTQCPSGKTPTISYSLTGEDGSFVPAEEFQKFIGASDAAVKVYTKVEVFGYKTVTFDNTVFIKKRTVTVTAASKTWVIDGEWHTDNEFTVSPETPDSSGKGFAADEGIDSLSMTAESKIKELGTQPNVIDQSKLKLKGETDLANYNVIWKDGTLTVRNPPSFTLKPYSTFIGKDGNNFNGKVYILHSPTTGYDVTTPEYLYSAFKSEAGLDVVNLGAVCSGYEVCAEFEVVNGTFGGKDGVTVLINGYTGAYRWLVFSKDSGGLEYMYLSNNLNWQDGQSNTINLPSSITWQGPGHLASGAAEPTSDKGAVTKGEDGNYTVTDIPTGTTEVKITIPEGVPTTATFTVPVDELASVSGVPADRLVVTVNGIVVDQKYFKGAQDGGAFNAELSDAAAPELVEETDELKPLVVDEDIALTVTVIPGLTYQLLRATELGGEKPSFAACGEPQTAAAEATTLKLLDVDKPADKAFYKVSVSK